MRTASIASQWGDKTAKEAGRLTLNPIPHVDPIGTLLFPIINMVSGMNFLIGWARPVPIDPRRFRKFRPGLFWVSLAGPAMNVLLAFISAAIFCAISLWVPETFYLHEPSGQNGRRFGHRSTTRWAFSTSSRFLRWTAARSRIVPAA